jgi:predicted nucleic acid-binding protein
VVYIDASALVKLVIAEAESGALVAWMAGRDLVSSAIAGVEVRRAVGVARATDAAAAAPTAARSLQRSIEDVLGRVTLITIEDRVLTRAAELEPPTLRTIDALHLATALTLRGPEGFVTYDRRLADAARTARLPVFSPGA